jgi:uncharacterized protein (UPF0335 family)
MSTDLNLFFPLFELSPQGWLNDFISSQVTRDKNGLAYSMLYKDFAICDDAVKVSIKKALDAKPNLYKQYVNASTSPDKLFYINGAYADKIENNILVKSDQSTLLKDYVLTLNSIKPFQMAFFQPYIKLYYGWKSKDNTKYNWVEFPFSQKFDLDTILNPADNSFLEGSGIKSVSNNQKFDLGIKLNAEITISYFFSSINILTKSLDSKIPYGFSFQKIMSNLGVDNETLKLEYGYKIDPGLFREHQIKPEICNLINEREKKEFLLLKTSHNFSFSKEGNVEITVNYKNRFESDIYRENTVSLPSKQNPANIRIFNKNDVINSEVEKLIDSIEKLTEQQNELNEEIKNITYKEYTSGTEKSKQVEKSISLKKDKEIQVLKSKMNDVSSTLFLAKRQAIPYFKDILLEKIRDNLNLFSITFNTQKDKENKIYKVNSKLNILTRENEKVFLTNLTDKIYDINDFLRGNPKSINIANSKIETVLNRIFNTPNNTSNTNKEFGHIVFFPLKALLRAAYEMLSPEEQAQIPSFLFGNLRARIFDDSYFINTGHILIEVKTFQKWMYDNFYSKNIIDFSFGSFISKIIDELVPEALYRKRTYPQTNTRLSIQDYSFCSINNFDKFKFSKNNLEHGERSQELINNLLNGLTRQKVTEYPLVIYSKIDIPSIQETTSCSFDVNTTNDLNLNEEQDAVNGIPHLVIGSDGGMFLTADFSQIDLKGLRTGVALQSLTDQNSSNFFYYYNLSSQVIGSSIFNFASFVCIPRPPLGFQGGEYDIGIVGYYKVLDLKDTLTPGSYKSVISGDWFWNPRLGKDGRIENSNITIPLEPSNIKDFVGINSLTPENYVKYLFDKDINTIINIDAKKSEIGKSKDKESKKQNVKIKKLKNESIEKDAK